MRTSVMKGFSFGLTSAIITTLGLIVGLNSSTHSRAVIIGGILVIAIADALSDSLGIHISEEAERKHSTREIWESTAATFISKFFFALTFILPIMMLPLGAAIAVSVAWGLSLIAVFSFMIGRRETDKPYKVAAEHLAIAIVVIIVTHIVGDMAAAFI